MSLNAPKYLFVHLAVLFLIASQAAAQSTSYTIAGKVLEKGSRRPLEGIAVYVEGNDMLTTTTAADGSFILATGEDGDYSIVAAGMGYEKSRARRVSFHGKNSIGLMIYLEPVSALPEIIVEAERNPDKTAKTVISGEELLSVPGSSGDPLRGMQALPGITTSSDYSSNPAIRGSGPEDNAFYVDFLPVGYLFHLGGLVSVINADLVDDFNIYASAFGPEFADVTGAVIDVKLRTPRQDRLGGKVNISLLETDLLVEGPVTDNQRFYLAGRRSYYDLLLSKQGDLSEGVSYTQFPQYYDYQGKYLWKINSDHRLTIQLSGAEDSMELSFTDDADFVKHDPVLAGDFTFDRAYHTQGLILDSRLSGRANNVLGLSYMKSFIDQQHDQLGTVKVDTDNAFVRDHLTVDIGSSHSLLTALEYTLTHIDLDLDTVKEVPSDYDPDTDYTSSERFKNDDVIVVNEFALGLKDRWKLLDDLTVIYGGRTAYDDFIEQWMLEPRTSLEYQIMQETLVTAGWGKYHQFPQGYQVIEGPGNPDLDYHKADHYTLGIEQGLPDLFSVKLEGYYKELYDLVVPHETKNYVNGGSGEAYGAELLLKKDRTDEWWGWLSVAYAETKRKNDRTEEEFAYRYDQPWIVNLVYNWAFRPKWTFGARWRYQSGAPYTPVIDTYTDSSGRVRPVYGELGSERLPDYHRLDLRLSRDFLFNTWKMGFYMDIINAYGHENVSGYRYNEDYSSREPIHQLPFLISIGLKAEF
jgi:hypothetical protein